MQSTRTRIKICGLTRLEDIDAATKFGADAIGFVFYPPSKRYVSPTQARTLTQNMPAFVSTVALFVNPSETEVRDVIETMRPSLLQFHGEESREYCSSFGIPYLKAFRIGAPELDSPLKITHFCSQYFDAAGWLFDSYTPAYGGSGLGFDYSLLSELNASNRVARPIVLSGGLNQSNVVQAIRQLSPWAVDVSSGVEDAPGIKSSQKMNEFVSAVRAANA